MSTRGCIARVDGDGFRGVYNHFDSYPDVLGKRLYELAQGRDLGDLLRDLIDEHPAGWISIGDECICHGKHRDGPMVVTDQENSDWVAWAYAIDEGARTMGIFFHWRFQEWRLKALVHFDGPAPDWMRLTRAAEAEAG